MDAAETIEQIKEAIENSQRGGPCSLPNNDDRKVEEKSNSPVISTEDSIAADSLLGDTHKEIEKSIDKSLNVIDNKEQTNVDSEENQPVSSETSSSLVVEESSSSVQSESKDECEKMDVDNVESESTKTEESTLGDLESTSMEVDELEQQTNELDTTNVLESDMAHNTSASSSTSVLDKTDTSEDSPINETLKITDDKKCGTKNTKEDISMAIEESDLNQSAGTGSLQKESECTTEEPSANATTAEKESEDLRENLYRPPSNASSSSCSIVFNYESPPFTPEMSNRMCEDIPEKEIENSQNTIETSRAVPEGRSLDIPASSFQDIPASSFQDVSESNSQNTPENNLQETQESTSEERKEPSSKEERESSSPKEKESSVQEEKEHRSQEERESNHQEVLNDSIQQAKESSLQEALADSIQKSKESISQESKESSPQESKESSPQWSKESSPRESKESSPRESKESSPLVSKESSPQESQDDSFQETSESDSQEAQESSVQKTTESPTRDTLENGSQEEVEIDSQDAVEGGSQKALGVVSQESPESGSRGVLESDLKETLESNLRETLKSSPRETLETGSQEISESGPQKTSESGYQTILESGSQDTPESGSQEMPESGSQKTLESGNQVTPESGFQKMPESGSRETPESAPQNTPESEPQEIPKSGNQETPESGSQKSSESGLQDIQENISQKGSDVCSRGTESSQDITLDSLQNITEGSQDTSNSSKNIVNITVPSSNNSFQEAMETSQEIMDNSQEAMDTSQDIIENSQDSVGENPVFVHVNTENEKGDDKNRSDNDAQENQDEEDFRNNQPQEDPIASDDFAPVQMEEENDEQGVDEEQGASEELCIIPDTERVISQEEKDAASTMVPLRDPADTNSAESLSKDASTGDATSGKYIISMSTDENVNACMQCCLPRKSKYLVTNNKKSYFVCDENCLNSMKDKYGDAVVFSSEGDLRVKNLSSGINKDNMIAKVKFQRKCMECRKKIMNEEFNLSWETMEFCNELCLSKYQKRIGSNCANCHSEVRSNCMGKYCVRFGYDIRQFCSSLCLEEYKKGLKVCSYCQKDMSGGGDGFLAPVGDKGQFKDFCTQQCMEKYDIMSNNREQPLKPGRVCSVCLIEKPITIEFQLDMKMNLFCGEPCFVAFKFVNNITPGKCDMCKKYFDNKILEENSMYYDSAQHSFCSKSCQNIYIIAHRRIVPCSWCKVKKYNFDMIKRHFSSGPMIMMCSLNCLSLYQVSLNAVNTKKITCDHCSKNLQPLYHLTMSDATIRNFCSYACVMAFQNQFPKTPITLNEPDEPVPTGAPKRTKKFLSKNSETSLMPADVPTIPVISSVQSLATTNGPTPASPRVTRAKNGTDASVNMNSNSIASPVIKTQIKQHVIIKPAPLPLQRNVATMCKVVTATKGTSHKPSMANKEVQTDEIQEKTALIPVPVPIYVPSPMWMYSMPFPIPFPFPLPVPVPIFIPTTRNSASGIMKEIKKIQVKIPTDPFEAELLMMAEMVAGDKKEENTDSESEEEDNTGPADEGTTFSPEPVDASNTFGDDMLQMALKMATELDEPAVDLEGALTASTITASQGGESAGTEESVDDPQPIHHMMERQAVRGRKRPGRPPKNAASKRGRRASSQMEIPMMAPPQPPPPPEPVEKPDANMCLKYTFGVNAWKQWVTTKNAELEKSSRRVKLFKPEILQLTSDELNYSLCLFVKEVRKPNGQEYAPDTIYYLCLGIQQYLFENGRIDNIFCDSYYEKFTDCLDEVAKKFSVLYNDSHYIVTRVEEEHLWESKQLGAHSPHVLLSTLMFFNTKHFNLTTVDEHMQLSFSHIMKHWKRNPNQPGTNKVAGSRNVLLRFYPPQTASDSTTRKKKVYEQQENEENPLRCPVKLYEFYLSKCPESVKTRNDVFYLLPERSCVPDSPVWYSTMPLPRNALEKMLHRVKMVKEINVALLTS